MADRIPEPSTDLATLNREKAQLRRAAIIILLIGLISSGLLYWLRTENSNLDQIRQSQAHAESRQMQLLYGRSGGLTSDLSNLFSRPGPQALLIIGISVAIAGACFYLGQPIPETEDDAAEELTK